jgi:hypothetical protein
VELIVEVVHPQVKLKATCKALTMGARLDFDAILQQTYFALCLWESWPLSYNARSFSSLWTKDFH